MKSSKPLTNFTNMAKGNPSSNVEAVSMSISLPKVPLIKVCGMRDSQNIKDLISLAPDFIGFIFYEKSKRYVGNSLDSNLLKSFPPNIKKVGVFVNESEDKVMELVLRYGLDFVQLHGEETPNFCEKMRKKGIKIIKAIPIDDNFDFEKIKGFYGVIDYFLFDTASPQKGGTGITFDWNILQNYAGTIPFLLAGGIDDMNIEKAKKIKHKYLIGFDLNSKFETEPGLKNISKLEKALSK